MKNAIKEKRRARTARRRRIRSKIFGTSKRPRLSIFRSNKHVCAQLIDDAAGVTIVSASDYMAKPQKGIKKAERAVSVGEEIAKAALERGIREVVFDRGGFAYHGRLKALADAARKAGLKF